jgi:hypothetical protein
MGQKADLEATRAAGFAAHLTKPASATEVVRLAVATDMAEVIRFEAERRA